MLQYNVVNMTSEANMKSESKDRRCTEAPRGLSVTNKQIIFLTGCLFLMIAAGQEPTGQVEDPLSCYTMAVDALQDAAEAAQDPRNAYTTAAAEQMAGNTATGTAAAADLVLVAVEPTASARRGVFTLQLPDGAENLTLSLQRHDFVFGTAFRPETASDLDWYLNTTKEYFWGLTPEDSYKWFNYEVLPGVVEPARTMLDRHYVQFARENGFPVVRGHTLEWYLTRGFWPHQLNCSEYVAALKQRITRDVSAFRGKFTQYDVFNEIIRYPGMLEKCDLWETAFPDAFKWAAAADPTAKLCLNDFSLIEADAGPKLIRLINDHLLPNGAPIHCIGIQAHFEEYGINITKQQQGLDLLASTGLELWITEFSLFSTWKGPGNKPISYLDEETQARRTVELLKLWFEHPAVQGIIMWEFWDNNIWIKNAGIFNANKTPKKAALAVRDLWQREWSTQLNIPHPATQTSFYGFYGLYAYSFSMPDGQQHSGTLQLSKVDKPLAQ